MRDSGSGLTARELRGLFEPWGGRRPGEAGAQMALHFTRLQVEQAGGRAWAESDGPGMGCLLGLSFPLAGSA